MVEEPKRGRSSQITRNAPGPLAESPRTPKMIIDQAISENRFNERLLYAFSGGTFLAGMTTLLVSLARNDGWSVFAGTVVTGFFLPAIRWANNIRKENIAIRCLELPLTQAKTEHEAAKILQSFFEEMFLKKGKSGS